MGALLQGAHFRSTGERFSFVEFGRRIRRLVAFWDPSWSLCPLSMAATIVLLSRTFSASFSEASSLAFLASLQSTLLRTSWT